MTKDELYLDDIREAIERLEKYTVQGREVFDRDELIQVWVLHHLQIIGEAVNNLSSQIRGEYAEQPWAQIIGLCHVLGHQYFRIDRGVIWQVIERDLPALKRTVAKMLADLRASGNASI